MTTCEPIRIGFPKSVVLHFIDLDQERVRAMFQELFDETNAVGRRIESFVGHCDELLQELIRLKPSYKSHYHDGQRIITLYLAFCFPEQYAIYKFTEFKTFMNHVRAKDVPGTGEYERFFKVVRTVYNIISKDEGLVTLQQSLLPDGYYKGDTLMLAQDFIWVTAHKFV